jgi:hypothetical protein
MAKQAAGTHQPLGYRNRVRLNAAIRHLKSPFHAVRVAAHKEIDAILNRKRGVRRLRAWFADRARAGVRKVTPKPLHKPLRVKAGAPQQAPSRGQATPIRAKLPKNGFTPLTDHVLTRAELKQRTKDAKARAGQRQQAPRPQPAPRRDAMQQATEAMRRVHQQPQEARSPGRPGQTSPFTEHRPAAAPSRNGQQAPTTGQEDLARGATGWRNYGAPAGRDHDNAVAGAKRAAPANVPPLPGHPDAVRKAAEDHAKGRWAGLRKRMADAPGRTRTGRSRTRTTA